MARFSKPQNTIEDVNELKTGDRIWHVYGIWPPQMGGEFMVTREASPFKDRPEYSDIHASSAELLVFDEQWADSDMIHMNFASDCNMQPGYSHNDNYCFRSEGDAQAAVKFLTEQWEASGNIAEEIARREEDRRFCEFADF